MTLTKTHDVTSTTAQIAALASAGCELVRVAVPKNEDAAALPLIVRLSPIPVIADIHFNASLAIKAIDAGVAAVRINPGNIGGPDKVEQVVRAAKTAGIPMRIGANSGSLPKHLHDLAQVDQAEALVAAALEEVELLEKLDYRDFKISVKATHVPTMIRAFRMLASKVPFPLHLGVTEAGTEFAGGIKSAVGIGSLLADGIGDTLRVSLTADPVKEVGVAWEILKALGLRERGPVMIACPSCGRDNVGVESLAVVVEERPGHPEAIEVAVMGCAVNGPGEAGDADFGIAGGRDVGFIYAHGRVLRKVQSEILVDELFAEIDRWLADGMKRPKRLKMAKPAALAMAEARSSRSTVWPDNDGRRQSQLFVPTLREPPTDAEAASHKLLVRGGFIRQVGTGLWTFLPLGWRVHQKVVQIIREEMDAIGSQEMLCPVLTPAELWERSGRISIPEVFKLTDRSGRPFVLPLSHEEPMTLHARELQSYKELPQAWYHFSTKERDEPRPRGGLLRVREFIMKDSYSFDRDEAGLDESFERHAKAYATIFERCGLEVYLVEAESGIMGGKESSGFLAPTESGENELMRCENGDYFADIEAARGIPRVPAFPEALPAPEEIDTPGVTTIDALADFLGMDAAATSKAMPVVTGDRVVLALVRGDDRLSEEKLMTVFEASFRPATEDEIRAAFGAGGGSVGPVGVDVEVVADETLREGQFVAGANRDGWHVRGVQAGRDYQPTFADIRQATEGDACPECGGRLVVHAAIEVGHIFKLGTFFSERFDASYLDEDGRERPLVMGSYGSGRTHHRRDRRAASRRAGSPVAADDRAVRRPCAGLHGGADGSCRSGRGCVGPTRPGSTSSWTTVTSGLARPRTPISSACDPRDRRQEDARGWRSRRSYAQRNRR
jgi:prolyl-tRNA synthetase